MANEKNVKSEVSKGGKTELSDIQKVAAQCWLAEFEGLRNLVLNFQRMQHSLIWVNISVIGAILTIYFAYINDITIFLAVPIVSSLLGIYWVSQGRQTAQIGHYIEGEIAPALQTLCHDQKVMVWEDYIREGMKTNFFPYVRDLVLLRVPRATGGLTFAASSMTAVVVTAIGLGRTLITCNNWQIASAWWAGLILTFWLIISGYKLGQYWIRAGK